MCTIVEYANNEILESRVLQMLKILSDEDNEYIFLITKKLKHILNRRNNIYLNSKGPYIIDLFVFFCCVWVVTIHEIAVSLNSVYLLQNIVHISSIFRSPYLFYFPKSTSFTSKFSYLKILKQDNIYLVWLFYPLISESDLGRCDVFFYRFKIKFLALML